MLNLEPFIPLGVLNFLFSMQFKIGIMGTNVFRRDTVGVNVIGGDWKLSFLIINSFLMGKLLGLMLIIVLVGHFVLMLVI